MGGPGNYPPFESERLPLSEAVARGGGPVAGRFREGAIEDATLRVELIGPRHGAIPEGAWVSGRLIPGAGGWSLTGRLIHTRPPVEDVDPPPAAHYRRIARARCRLTELIRDFFQEGGFIEVDTPRLVVCPAVEPHLDAVTTEVGPLATSPELAMKRLLVSGMERIFEIGRVFRREAAGRRHLGEFTMLEWYRAFGRPEDVLADLEGLAATVAGAFGRTVTQPLPRLSWRQAFRRETGLDPFGFSDRDAARDALRVRAGEAGFETGPDDTFELLCEGLFAALVEPGLARHGALVLTDFPAWTAALARTREVDGVELAQRYELYLDGLEIANAYHELNDPVENRRRLAECNRIRRSCGKAPYALDEGFDRDMDRGMPPAVGAALGVDRLLMWLLKEDDIRDVILFRES